MSRKETSNTFSEGMVKDLNPINTPNTVLTDCLNGTLITYDGNEYSLQNEKGNYPLKNCKLKPNYIPVGVREYGDILYIVSYNPLDEHVEIGSYPSPETIHDADDMGKLSQTVNSVIGSLSGNVNYSEIVELNQPLYIFYGASEYGPDEYKLNPGDLYKISKSDDLIFSKYEELKYFVFDENRRSYDITENINNDKQNKQPTQGFYHVSWDIPGWIAVQPKFAEITDFSINIKRIVVPSYGNSDIKLNLNFQLTTDDILYTKNATNAAGDLKVKFTITAVKKDGTTTTVGPNYTALSEIIDLKNGSLVFHSNDWGNELHLSASEYATLTIEAVPYIEANNSVNVFYDNFAKTLTFNLGQKGSVDDFDIGKGRFWYNTDSKNLEFNLIFDTKGLANSSVMEEDVFLFYSLYKLDNNPVSYIENNVVKYYENMPCKDWNIIGETTISLKMKEFTSANWNSSNYYFYPEEFYIVKFNFYDTGELSQDQQPLNETPIYKFITASELMNNQTAACYDEVAFDEWAGKYLSSIKNKKIKLSADPNPTITVNSPTINNEGKQLFSILNSSIPQEGDTSKKYSTVIDDSVFLGEDPIKKDFTIECVASSEIPITYGSDIELLSGPMWMGLLEDSYIIFDNDGDSPKGFNEFTGKLEQPTYSDKTITGTGKKELTYTLNTWWPGVKVWGYDIQPLRSNTDGNNLIFATGAYVAEEAYSNTQTSLSLRITTGVPGSNDYTMKQVYTNNTQNIRTDAIELLDNVNFGNYDVLFVKMGIGTPNDGSSVNGSAIRLEGLSSGTVIENDATAIAKYKTFALIKLSPTYSYNGGRRDNVTNSRQWTPVAAIQIPGNNDDDILTNFYTWCARFKKLICFPDSVKSGAFYTADLSNEKVSGSLKVSMGGTLFFADPIYDENYNLLSSSSRDALAGTIPFIENTNNLILIKDADILSFGNVSLDTKEEVIKAELDFSEKDSEISVLESIINQFNTYSKNQADSWGADFVFQDPEIDQYTEKYIVENPNQYSAIFLELLNKQTFEGSDPLYYEVEHTISSNRIIKVRKYIAQTSTNQNYNNHIN